MTKHIFGIETSGPTSRREITDRKILDSAFIEFSEYGFQGASTVRIMKRAGYAPSLFQKNWKTKLAVFMAVLNEWHASEEAAVVAAMKKAAFKDVNDAVSDILMQFRESDAGFRSCLALAGRHNSEIHSACRDAFHNRAEAVLRVAPNLGRGGREQIYLLIIESVAARIGDVGIPLDRDHGREILTAYVSKAV